MTGCPDPTPQPGDSSYPDYARRMGISLMPARPGTPIIHPDVIAEVKALCEDKGWRNNIPPRTRNNELPYSEYIFAGYCALAHSEISEALESYRDKDWSSTRVDGKPMGVGPEIADAFIRLMDMVSIWEIDINYEVRRVLDYGWTRPYQHGGRTL